MSLVTLDGQGFWLPAQIGYQKEAALLAGTNLFTLDADEEEVQIIGTVTLAGGGSKTFGTSSKIGWLPGTANTFATGSTLRIGLKQGSKVDTATGPPARATIGAAAFDMSKALVGGTDTITNSTWREETMVTGTPLTVAQGDLIAVCFHLDVASGTPSITLRGNSTGGIAVFAFPALTLVTSGPTYTNTAGLMNMVLVFDDGTIGWIEPMRVVSVLDANTGAIGSGNRYANIVQLPFPCQIDALAAYISGTGDFALEVLGTPLGTPSVLATLAFDLNVLTSASSRVATKALATPLTLAANTAYAIAVRQTTATSMLAAQYDVADVGHFKPNGFPGTCYAAISTAGGTFVAQNSQRRRYLNYMRVSALDNGAGGALRAGPPRVPRWRFARSAP